MILCDTDRLFYELSHTLITCPFSIRVTTGRQTMATIKAVEEMVSSLGVLPYYFSPLQHKIICEILPERAQRYPGIRGMGIKHIYIRNPLMDRYCLSRDLGHGFI